MSANPGTLSGLKFYISNDPVDEEELNEAGYEALYFTQVKRVMPGSVEGIGRSQAISESATLDGAYIKGKGAVNHGTINPVFAYVPDDAGQVIMRTAGLSRRRYAIKVEHNDATGTAPGDLTATIDYAIGIIAGPTDPASSDEDFRQDAYEMGLVHHLRVLPSVIPTP